LTTAHILPRRTVLRSVALLALPNTAPFEFGLLCEVFGLDRTDDGVPPIDFRVVTADPGRLPFRHGMSLEVPNDLAFAEEADLIAVPAFGLEPLADERVLGLLRRAHARGAWVLSVCTGAFLLGEAGLLDGRPCTTHWRHAAELQARNPAAQVDPNVLFVDVDHIVTGAGTAAGIDAALHVVRSELGAGVANTIARRMVVPPQRDGGQSQYIEAPVPMCESDSLVPVLAWMQQHLDEDITVDALARRALMSPRTFARRFRAETGTTPLAWLTQQRVQRARELLEATEWSVDTIAHAVGFGNGTTLRHHFARTVQTSPHAYRTAFSTVPR
jgi:transcriptional regulator GlxA family with amidase domain